MVKDTIYFRDIDVQAEYMYDYFAGVINIKYFNEYIGCYEKTIVSPNVIYTTEGFYNLIVSNIPRVHINRKKLIAGIL